MNIFFFTTDKTKEKIYFYHICLCTFNFFQGITTSCFLQYFSLLYALRPWYPYSKPDWVASLVADTQPFNATYYIDKHPTVMVTIVATLLVM